MASYLLGHELSMLLNIMGNIFGCFLLKYNDKIPGQNQLCRDVFTKLMLTDQDINRFYATYQSINKKYSNSLHFIEEEELFAQFRIESTDLNKKIFRLYGKSGHIDFLQFVCLMWNFLSTEPSALSQFAFYLFCDRTAMTMSAKQLDRMMQTMFGKSYLESVTIAEIIGNIQGSLKHEYSRCTEKEFDKLCQEHRSFVYPLMTLQLSLRNKFLGETFWKEMTRRRYKIKEMTESSYILEVSDEAAEHNEFLREKKARSRSNSIQDLMSNAKNKILPVTKQRRQTGVERKASSLTSQDIEANRRRWDNFPNAGIKAANQNQAGNTMDYVEMINSPDHLKRGKYLSDGNAADLYISVEGSSGTFQQRVMHERSKESPRSNSTTPRSRLNSMTSPRRSPKTSPLSTPRNRRATTGSSPRVNSPGIAEAFIISSSTTCGKYSSSGTSMTVQELYD